MLKLEIQWINKIFNSIQNNLFWILFILKFLQNWSNICNKSLSWLFFDWRFFGFERPSIFGGGCDHWWLREIESRRSIDTSAWSCDTSVVWTRGIHSTGSDGWSSDPWNTDQSRGFLVRTSTDLFCASWECCAEFVPALPCPNSFEKLLAGSFLKNYSSLVRFDYLKFFALFWVLVFGRFCWLVLDRYFRFCGIVHKSCRFVSRINSSMAMYLHLFPVKLGVKTDLWYLKRKNSNFNCWWENNFEHLWFKVEFSELALCFFVLGFTFLDGLLNFFDFSLEIRKQENEKNWQETRKYDFFYTKKGSKSVSKASMNQTGKIKHQKFMFIYI